MKDIKTILHVEDDSIDVMSTKRAFKALNFDCEIIHAKDGMEGINYLLNEENKKPQLILLDLNLPFMNGFEFLDEKNKIESLKIIPTVIFSTSTSEQDRLDAYKKGASGYMVKPMSYEGFVEKLKFFIDYWKINEIPYFD